jgi:hypothetical protein
MIVKRILSPKSPGGFRKLAAYMLNVKLDGADPVRWALGSYVLDAEHGGSKVGWAKATNCGTSDLGWATKAIIAHNSRNTRARANKAVHLVVSFPAGERPTRVQIEDIEQELCETIGFGSHMRISATHTNTATLHLHIGISRICPKTLHALHPHGDWWKLQAKAAELEIKHGLTLEPHTRSVQEAVLKREGGNVAQKLPAVSTLFQRRIADAVAARDKAMRELRAEHADYARRLSAWHSERFRQEKARAERGPLRRQAFAHLADQRRADRTERMAREAIERKALLAAYPLPRREDYALAQRQVQKAEPAQPRLGLSKTQDIPSRGIER